MTNRSCLTKFALSALLIATVATEASAVPSQRTFVSSSGSDASANCNLAAPCRGFAAAMAQTLDGGEVIVLDSAGYGVVTINQAVSIIAPPGVYAGISVSSGVGITVNAPGKKVTLRGLTINNVPAGTTGVLVSAATTVYIDRLTITGFATGLSVSASATVNVLQSAFRDNGTGASFAGSGGTATISIEGSVFERNTIAGASFGSSTAGAIVGSLFAGGGAGVAVNASGGSAKVEIRDTNINDNTGSGVSSGGGGGVSTVSVVSSVVSGNNIGLSVTGAANEVYSSDTTITRNATGLSAPSGTMRTSQDNRLVNNTIPGAFNTITGKQ